jgi:thiol-disulfide isomerase/thioredoxin/AAA+ superfamily predicted ATPase
MAELGYRKNAVPVFTNAGDLLSAQKPLDEFMDCVQKADGGCLMIDEASMFDPAPRGKTGNDSNKILDALMKVSVTMCKTTTFILCGYKDDLLRVMTYNPGMESRFSKQFRFEFVDYTELQLTKILANMVKGRKYRFESKKECGIAIARVLARDLAHGANKKDFGNGRACEKIVELCVERNKTRLGKMMAAKKKITEWDYITLTRSDTVGERPHLEDSPYVAELNAMIGLKSVKEAVQSLMNLQLQNFDAKMRGENVQRISLHRVFLGNPGTGKTTVAKLMGKILKEFNFLSDGDFVGPITPSDLKGSAVGEAGERTKALLDSAKGKVLFIDEAYNLDPARHTGSYGAEVIDTILEKIEGNAGSDMCLILAGYKPQMEQFFRNANNEGLKRRLNLSEAFHFEDFSDEDIKKVLKNQIVNTGLTCEPTTLDFAVSEISKKRMEDGFGNAGEAEQILSRAKVRHGQRMSKITSSDASMKNRKLLIRDDFAGEETSVQKAREAFAGLDHMGHIDAILNKFEAMVSVAIDEGRKPHEELANMHMLFLGPPGTGKTTCGRRFATMLKQLEVLPTDRFEYITAGQLIDRYVGGTANNTHDAMKRAKGGILFIDEAYGMVPKGNGNFGSEIMQALLDDITSDEFRGKILVILGGYKEHVEEIFAMNAGFQGRFDKIRVEFPEWTGDQASSALINRIILDGKSITEEAQVALPGFFNNLADLPNWASARDVMENVKSNLEGERATRSFNISKARRENASANEAATSADGAGPASKRVVYGGSAARKALPPPIPFELEDVIKTFDALIRARGGTIEVSGSGGADGSPTQRDNSIKKVPNMRMFEKEIQKRKLTVVDFFADWCGPCHTIAPVFKQLSERLTDVNFVKVDGDKSTDITKRENVRAYPTFKFYYDGNELSQIQGADPRGLEAKIMELRTSVAKQAANRRPEPETQNAGSMGAPPPPKAKLNYNIKVKTSGGNEEDGDKGDDFDVWQALEDACNQLGWGLEEMKTMLEDVANFPPPEIMQIIMASTGCSDAPKIKAMLSPQRMKVLQSVKTSIKEAKRKKTDEEEKVQTALKKIGNCCMGFAWLPLGEGAGYQCAGGAHFCSSADVDQELMRMAN